MRRLLILLGVVLLVISVSAVVVRRMLPTSVAATSVVRGDVSRTLVLTGRVRPPVRPQLGAAIAGTVRDVLVREGDRVTRGQVLLRLDDAQVSAGLAQARAALAAAEARAQSTADQASIALAQATRDLERARSLYASGAISARDLEVADRAATVARSELDVAGTRAPAGLSTPLAEVARARAAVAAAEALIALTRVTAPAAATVLARHVEPGNAVVPGQLLIDMALDGATELVVYSREENLRDLRVGATAVASADAFPDSTFAAHVAWIAPAVDPSQGTVEARLAVARPPRYLRPDMTISINVEVECHTNALVVPVDAVRDANTSTPWVLVPNNSRAERRPVRLGLKGDHGVEIRSGLAAGDRVLPATVTPGQRVRLQEP
jgi:HlyD family secretion protein